MAMTSFETKYPGRIYKQRNKRADGTAVDKTTWTVRYKGRDHATGETDGKKAEQFLIRLIAGVPAPVAVPVAVPAPWRRTLAAVPVKTAVSVATVLDNYLADAEERDLAVTPVYRGSIDNHLKPFFGSMPVDDLNTTVLKQYRKSRLSGVAEAKRLSKAATINRELALLKSALKLASQENVLQRFPHIKMLPESSPREGFLQARFYDRLRQALPAYWEPVFVAGYHTGRRRGELLQIELVDVDWDAMSIRVYSDATKNGKPSLIPIYGDMIETLRKQMQKTRHDYPACTLLFHKNGKRIQKNQTFYDQWDKACEIAGVPGLLFHDLRRTACKMLIDSGNSRKEAKAVTGHITDSAFDRYHIVNSESLSLTTARAAAFLAKQHQAV